MSGEFARFSSEPGPESVEPIGWQGGYDWEVYRDGKPMEARLYDEDVLMARVSAKGPRRLARKMRREEKRLGITKATVF